MIAQRVIAVSTFAAVFLVAHVAVAGQSSQTFQPEFRHVLTYGDDPDAPLQQLLVDVEVLTTDDRDRVFIGDTGDLSIKVIDLQAGFVHRMGGKGSAPGEFRDISALTVDASGHLLVFDGTNDRVSRFSPDGEMVETIRLDLGPSVELRNLRQLANGQYLSLFTPSFKESTTPIFHVISQDLTTELDAFGPIPGIDGADDVVLDEFVHLMWKDESDRFYLLDEANAPLLHVVELSY